MYLQSVRDQCVSLKLKFLEQGLNAILTKVLKPRCSYKTNTKINLKKLLHIQPFMFLKRKKKWFHLNFKFYSPVSEEDMRVSLKKNCELRVKVGVVTP